MNKTIGLQLVVFSLLLAGLSLLTHYVAPGLARPTLVTGLAGGVLCLVWGLRAIRGSRGKALPMLTLAPVTYVMLSQTITAWSSGGEAASGRRAAAFVIATLFVLSLGMLLRVAYAGALGSGQSAGAAKDNGSRPQTPGDSNSQTNGIKRA